MMMCFPVPKKTRQFHLTGLNLVMTDTWGDGVALMSAVTTRPLMVDVMDTAELMD